MIAESSVPENHDPRENGAYGGDTVVNLFLVGNSENQAHARPFASNQSDFRTGDRGQKPFCTGTQTHVYCVQTASENFQSQFLTMMLS